MNRFDRASFPSTTSKRSASRLAGCGAILCFVWLMTPATVLGQTLDDFKRSAGSASVDLIPFPDLRRDASAIDAEVKRRKAETDSLSYDQFEKRKNKLLEAVAARKKLIERIQAEIKQFQQQYAEFDARTLEDDVRTIEKEIEEQFAGKIKAMNEEMTKAAEVFDRLAQARGGLREAFEDAQKLLNEARSSPEKYLGSGATDDQKKELVGHADKILDKIRSEIGEHQAQENGAKATKANFDRLISKTS